MIDKILRYCHKTWQWHIHGRNLGRFRTQEQLEAFVRRTGCAPDLVRMWKELSDRSRVEARKIVEFYEQRIVGKRVLDVGPGYGDFLDVCLEHDASTVGVDYDPFVVRWLQLRGHLAFKANFLKSLRPLNGNLFDFVYLRASIVAEYFHLTGQGHLRRFLQRLEGVGAPGALVVICPYFELRLPERVRRTPDPRNCPFTSGMQACGYAILEDGIFQTGDPVVPLTFGKAL